MISTVQLNIILWSLLFTVSFGAVAQIIVKRTYERYAKGAATAEISAEQLARTLLDRAGLLHVSVVHTEKLLDDRYDPNQQKLYTSNPTGTSIAALVVTAHEVGHALQHEQNYWALGVRQVIQPFGYLGAGLALITLLLGWSVRSYETIFYGGLVYLVVVLLMLSSLPVEFDANRRALKLLQQGDYIKTKSELRGAKRMLLAAMLTYVGAALSPLVHGVFMFWSYRQR